MGRVARQEGHPVRKKPCFKTEPVFKWPRVLRVNHPLTLNDPITETANISSNSHLLTQADEVTGVGVEGDLQLPQPENSQTDVNSPMMVCGQSREEATRRTLGQILTPKHCVKIGTWNVQTLWDTAKGLKLAKEMDRYGLEILGVSECRYTGSGRTQIGDKSVVYSGRTDGIHREGVALFCSKNAIAALIEWEPIDGRMIVARFNTAGGKMTIIMCYAPTEVSDEEAKDAFYRKLNDVCNSVPTHDTILLIGDMNAKVGSRDIGIDSPNSSVGVHGIGVRNNNGTRLVDFCDEAGLVIGGTMFPHRNIHKGTWRSPNMLHVNQIDHIIISRRHRSFLQDVKAFRGADIGQTDHYLLISKVRLKLKKERKNTRSPVFDSGKLVEPSVKREFVQTLENKLQAPLESNEEGVEGIWITIKKAYTETAEEVLGRRRRRREEWISQEAWQKIKEKKDLKIKMESSEDLRVRGLFKELHKQKAKEIKKITRRDKRRFYHRMAEEAEAAGMRGDQRSLYRLMKDLGGAHSSGGEGIIKDIHGNNIVKEEEKAKRWRQHFQSVLNGSQPTNLHRFEEFIGEDLPINIDNIRHDEVSLVIQRLKNNKSPGEDLISGEMLKATVESGGVEKLHELLCMVWETEVCPEDWKRGTIVKLPKKGNLAECSNWRGITLLSVPGKIMAMVILDRIYTVLDEKLREGQAGFRRGRSCADQIFALRNLIEQSEEWRRQLIINFIDFKRAFDSVHRPTMWKILRSYGIPIKIINVIKLLYEGSSSCVRVGGSNTESFEITSGVKQGDVLSPVLFVIVVDWIMRRIIDGEDGIVWVDNGRLPDLAYADDIALLSEDVAGMSRLTEKLELEARKVGLEINLKKTKLMAVQQREDMRVELGGEEIEMVEKFEYLGSVVCNDGDVRKEVAARIGKAGAAFSKMKNVWNSRGISLKTKVKLFNGTVMSILLYGSETWKGLKEVENRLRRFESNCLRKIMGIKWYDHVTEDEVRRRSGQPSVIQKMKTHRWRYFGHVLRMNEERLPRQTLYWTPEGSRRRGRPKETWRRTIQREMRTKELEMEDVERLACCREDWRRFIADLWAI